jgi:hypothetical protein
MATSVYFNNYGSSQEQDLLHDLVIEAIRIYGVDMYYVPRELKRYDNIYGADTISEYNKAVLVELYVKSVDGFTGDGNFMSKFGLQIRDQAVFSISQRIFSEEVGIVTNQIRPNEGDLIYFPLNEKCFKIMYVKKQEFFYPLGTLPTWEITVELFEYASERLNTGIAEIDRLQTDFSMNILDYVLATEDSNIITDELGNFITLENYDQSTINPAADNDAIQSGTTNYPLGSDDFIDFSERNPFASSNY